ncbi:MAG: acetylornithine/succinylornithine family transaminase [Verrucomicrobia bacterium]|nr:acetylornithine/succinylornithine family transaminase [Verrucomicrobiota bacterium]MDA1066530.1 acetylornithine/succinylornithine family transaminase [Verrucomicrobiota bacterium]
MNFTKSTETQYTKYRLNNYSAPSITLVKGEGEFVWDENNKQYLDFTTGIATVGLGHCHPALVKAIQGQAEILIHVSNLFRIKPQGDLAEALVSIAGPGRIFFCNSGTESSETLIKLSRLFGIHKSGTESPATKVIVSNNGFHGRTFGGMSATPQEKIQKGFFPMLPNFPVGKLNDIQSFAALMDEDTAAVLIEPIQGEGGIHVASKEFLQELRALCTAKNILLLIDEVQSGNGRTGTFFAHEIADIKADAVGMAKGLGGGFPIGAVWISEAYAGLFKPGSHGSTFGGNPLACAAALAVLDTIEKEDLLTRVKELSQPWIQQLEALKDQFDILNEVRGRGFLIGLDFKEDPTNIQKQLEGKGLLTVRAGGNVLRLLPPLTVAETSLQKSIEILASVFSEVATPITNQ